MIRPALFLAALTALATPAVAANGLTTQQCRSLQQQTAKSQAGLSGLLKALQGASLADLANQTSGSLHEAALAHEQSRNRLVPALDDYLKSMQRLQGAFRNCR